MTRASKAEAGGSPFPEGREALASYALLERLYSRAPIGLGFCDTDLHCRRVNECLAAMNGLPVEEHRGKTLPEILGPLGERLEPILREVLRSGTPVLDFEVIGATAAEPERQRRWLASWYPVYAPTGLALGVGAVVIEVGARREAEDPDYREIAHRLQASLLPLQLPEIPGIETAARYRAAGRANEVGGDFYDVYSYREGVWSFLIGDVAGKGAEAAALTALVRHTVQAAGLRGETARGGVELAQAALLRRAGASEVCTAVAGELVTTPRGAEVRLVCAGHPSPLVLRRDATVEEVTERGPLLGVFPDVSFPEVQIELAGGDLLLLYTDGALEIRGAAPGSGEAALHDVLRASAGLAPADLLARIEQEALRLSGGELGDDLALLAFRVPVEP